MFLAIEVNETNVKGDKIILFRSKIIHSIINPQLLLRKMTFCFNNHTVPVLRNLGVCAF